MTRKIAAAVAVMLTLAGLAVAAGAREAINPDKINLGMDIGKLNVEQLRLYRNAVYARHCYYFKDAMLRSEFHAYQDKKCGEEMYWDEPKPFDAGRLTAPEKDFMARLGKREAELKAGQVKVVDGKPVYAKRAIVNGSQFADMPKPVKERLLKDGFVVVPGKSIQLFHVYEENDYRSVPNFITTDSVLQLYHLYFDFTLRELEEQKLLPAARELATGMAAKLNALDETAKDPGLQKGLRIAILYFAVAEDLASEEPVEKKAGAGAETYEYDVEIKPVEAASAADFDRPPPTWLKPEWKGDFLAQRKLILKAAETEKGPVMGTVDYTMFKPRGHYTRSAKLIAYFRTMMWLGLPGFILDEEVMPIEAALATVYELTHSPELMAKYDLIYEPTNFYVGPTDDITPELVRKVADEICGQDATLEQWIGKKEEIRKELIKRNPARIVQQYPDDRGKPQARFMGMRYIPDSEILQRLTNRKLRPFPTGLDLFGVMGVPAALQVLKAAENRWPGYWPEMDKLQAEFKDLKPASGEMNLYWRWIRLLKTLNQPAPDGAAPFMRTKPWEFKNLNASLASWSELRHDTILYAKPSGAECGGDEMPARTVGYVEARPDFFRELAELQIYTTSELKKQGLLTERLTEVGGRLAEMFSFLERVSGDEVASKKQSDEDYEAIRIMGSQMEYLTVQILASGGSEWVEVAGPDKYVAVVADVHTADPFVLEEAVGYADEIYALVEIEGYLYITRGPVFSYYEFQWPATDRLTDEQWQKILNEGKAPPRPSWSTEFMVNEPAGTPSGRESYSSGC
ncbi:MAG TPA: DUF3160 domain-containing protein [bacterium]|nr:DUF3160 domain-containing protein [bacterium]